MLDILKNLTQMTGSLISKYQAGQIFDQALTLYRSGEFKKALPLMKEAAEKGSPHAMAHLGVMLLKGEGVMADWVKAAELFRMTLKLQDYQGAHFSRAELNTNLGLIYAIGGYGLKRDQQVAKQHLQQAVEEGDDKASEVLKMVVAKKGVFGKKETAKPEIKW